MDNLKLPAYPFTTYDTIPRGDGISIPIQYTDKDQGGFTKIELASLMIAQGMAANSTLKYNDPYKDIPDQSVKLAKAVLEEANK